MTPLDLARMFHETYESLAPKYGYKTRESSAVPWESVPEPNRSLMVATCERVLDALKVREDAFTRVLSLMSEYPLHVVFEMGMEESEEDHERFFFVSIHEKAPEGGWPSAGAYFRSTKGAIHWKQPVHPADTHATSVHTSVSAVDAETCARLAENMISKDRRRYDDYPPTEENAPTIEELCAGSKRA